ncbi:ClpXP protease specificity-enhancing factor [Zophobihabitans entericus]|uniref:ClpXP protease specificity-enhancing factor n=1 Tax=Zophobihabitans entericus TaxID=1635327 RepID=A0A6G9IDG1_9GAMM|nr:ClpXP protease specificity-enhancing factor [Zophobihabitans entericus]
MELSEMSPRRPYLFRAFYDWILDNELTPYVVVDATRYGVDVPFEFVKDGQIVLNIAPQSVGQFNLNNDGLAFNARFGGVPHQITVPMSAIEAIYARENGAGIAFEPEPFYDKERDKQLAQEDATNKPDTKGRPTFRVVK